MTQQIIETDHDLEQLRARQQPHVTLPPPSSGTTGDDLRDRSNPQNPSYLPSLGRGDDL